VSTCQGRMLANMPTSLTDRAWNVNECYRLVSTVMWNLRMIRRNVFLVKWLFALLVMVIPAFAAPPKCKGNPKVVDACYSVHGRLTRGADTVILRLWPVGTKRILGVTAGPELDDANDPIWPQNLKFEHGDEDIYGDFEVCPFTPERKGEMQLVCVESASHVVVKRQSSSK
jgi:hypothetical protein